MNNNFLGIRGLYKTHVDGLKPFDSKSVTYTYIGYTEHNSREQPIVRRAIAELRRLASRPYSRNELKSMAFILLCFMAGMPGDEQQGVSSTLVAANNFFR